MGSDSLGGGTRPTYSSGFIPESRLVQRDECSPLSDHLERREGNSAFLEHLPPLCWGIKQERQLVPVMRWALVHGIRNGNPQTALAQAAEQLLDYKDLWLLLTWARSEPLT